ncbi:hypothetical protein K2173_022851 [Erythroxylum novogranatense]|uniref:Uncharacterized protein n=1 Tax=Erythroxylum novogranatense TaxID=1862640 RepID=A0AAV8SMY4_9ROSI|nr:hypothetical protein K2173_022851 [Erythroxylum novogranatense]
MGKKKHKGRDITANYIMSLQVESPRRQSMGNQSNDEEEVKEFSASNLPTMTIANTQNNAGDRNVLHLVLGANKEGVTRETQKGRAPGNVEVRNMALGVSRVGATQQGRIQGNFEVKKKDSNASLYRQEQAREKRERQEQSSFDNKEDKLLNKEKSGYWGVVY